MILWKKNALILKEKAKKWKENALILKENATKTTINNNKSLQYMQDKK